MPWDDMRLAVIGDSFSAGYGVPTGNSWVARLESRDLPGRVLTLAHEGATVRRWLPGGPWHTELDQLTPFFQSAPAKKKVAVSLGPNDWYITRKTSEYVAHLGQLVTQIRNRAPDADLVFIHSYPLGIAQNSTVCDIDPCTPKQSPPPTWHAYGQAMWEAAMTAGADYIDIAEGRDWSRLLGPDKPHEPDKTHLTSYGHFVAYQAIRARLLTCC